MFSSAAKMKITSIAIFLVALASMACGDARDAESIVETGTDVAGSRPVIRFVDNPVDSLRVINAVAAYITEHGYEHPADVRSLTIEQAWNDISSGDADVVLEMWAQNFPDLYDTAINSGLAVDLGPIHEGGEQFWMVPLAFAREFDIKRISDLSKPEVVRALADRGNPSEGTFYNCILEWPGCETINRIKLKSYGLDHLYQSFSPVDAGALEQVFIDAQESGHPIFGYYFSPTSLIGRYDWRIIEEPPFENRCWDEIGFSIRDPERTAREACAYPPAIVVKLVNASFEARAPAVFDFFSKFDIGLHPLNLTLAWAADNGVDLLGEPEKVANHYLSSFPLKLQGWVPDDVAAKVNKALERTSEAN